MFPSPLTRAVVTLVVALATPLVLAPAAFAAATINPYAVSADPTEDEPVTIAVSGSTDVATNLHVFQRLSSQECMPPNIEYNRITATTGTPIPAGAFSVTVSFTPTAAGNYRVCAYVATSVYATPTATQSEMVSVRLPIASIDPVQISADPTEDEPVTLTVTGTSEAVRRLFVYQRLNSQECMSPNIEYNRLTSTTGTEIGPGPFAEQFTFTPSDAGDFRLCAYVGESVYVVPLASSSQMMAVRRPEATIQPIVTSADPTEVEPVTITVTGSSEAARNLFVYQRLNSQPCMSPQIEYNRLTSTTGTPVGPGAFSASFEFTPSAAGAYRVCAYVGESVYAAPLTSGTTLVEVRRPHASVDVSGVAPYLLGSTSAVALVGTAEHADVKLAWTLTSGTCDCDFDFFKAGSPVPQGAFSVPVNLTFTSAPTHTLCVRLTDTKGQLAVFSREIKKAPGVLTPSLPRGTAGVRDGAPVFSWAQTNWPQPRSVTLTVSNGSQLDADGRLRSPVLQATRGFVSATSSGSLAPAKRLPAGTYYWNLAWNEAEIGSGYADPVQFRVAPIRFAIAGRASVSKTKTRNVRFAFRVRDNVRASRVRVIVKRGRRVLASKGYPATAILESSSRSASFRLGTAVSAGQRLTLLVEVRDRFGVARDAVKVAVPKLPAPPRPARPPSSGGVGGGCHPSYRGACLQQGIGDYDCAGGSGNGPNYISGPISVVGPDEFDLDRDGDGVACEN